MKKFIILFSVFLLFSCSNSDKNTNIQTNITTNSGDVDIVQLYNPISGMYRLDGDFERDFDVPTGIDHRFVSDDLDILIREMR